MRFLQYFAEDITLLLSGPVYRIKISFFVVKWEGINIGYVSQIYKDFL